MARVLVCLIGILTVWQIGNVAAAQESAYAPARASASACDALPDGPSDCQSNHAACMRACFQASCCCDDYNPHPFPCSHVSAYPPWYQCVPAGDVSCCPKTDSHQARRTWWFIPTRHALKEALWLIP